MNRVFIFPGQGSHTIGMGRHLYENFAIAKQVFDEADDALQMRLSELMFFGEEDELTQTQNTQPALMVVSVAVTKVIEHLSGKKLNMLCSAAAGHSLGQYSAICAADGIDIGTCAKILRARGIYMNNACPAGMGSMAAIIGASKNDLDNIIELANTYGICDVANDNSNDQLVISGLNEAIDFAIQKFKEINIKAIKLKVSSPFHSRLMSSAAQKMKEEFANYNFSAPLVPIIDNVTLKITSDVEFLKKSLIDQIAGTVRWRETMQIIAKNYDSAFELGAGKVLTNLFKKSYNEFRVHHLSEISDIESFIKEIEP